MYAFVHASWPNRKRTRTEIPAMCRLGNRYSPSPEMSSSRKYPHAVAHAVISVRIRTCWSGQDTARLRRSAMLWSDCMSHAARGPTGLCLETRAGRSVSAVTEVLILCGHIEDVSTSSESPSRTIPTIGSACITFAFFGPSTQSDSGLRIYASIAALNAANPPQPSAAACGPALNANAPPVIHPATTLFVRSFFALSPSIAHSVPLYAAPMIMKFFAEEYDLDPISFNPLRSWSRTVSLAIS
jgi:hypothetical protein